MNLPENFSEFDKPGDAAGPGWESAAFVDVHSPIQAISAS
jgi:hypothetical protein